jgi:hypothetical protein
MLIVAFVIMFKTFFFIRIFKSCSVLVQMIGACIYDLKSFFVLFFVFILLFSQFFAILDLGNFKVSDDVKIRYINVDLFPELKVYSHLPRFIANMISILRICLGNSEFESSLLMEPFQNYLFWISWILIVTVMFVVILNFIIAEVTNSYEIITEKIQPIIVKERGSLINEAQSMFKAIYGEKPKEWKKLFPTYIIKR